MNREREFAVMVAELSQNHTVEDAAYQVIKQYGSELKRAITSRLGGEIDGMPDGSCARDGAITDCIRWVDELVLKPTWPKD